MGLESLTFAYSEWNLTAPLFKIPRKTIPNQNITHIFVDFFSFFSENFENSQLKFKGKSENLEVVKKSHRKSENRKKLRNERFRLSRYGFKKILRKNIDS